MNSDCILEKARKKIENYQKHHKSSCCCGVRPQTNETPTTPENTETPETPQETPETTPETTA